MREVTELDFRQPEFWGAKVEDYEFRDDGKIVRKDRWETAIFSIAHSMGFSSRSGFEIVDVVEKTCAMARMVDEHIGSALWLELTGKESSDGT